MSHSFWFLKWYFSSCSQNTKKSQDLRPLESLMFSSSWNSKTKTHKMYIFLEQFVPKKKFKKTGELLFTNVCVFCRKSNLTGVKYVLAHLSIFFLLIFYLSLQLHKGINIIWVIENFGRILFVPLRKEMPIHLPSFFWHFVLFWILSSQNTWWLMGKKFFILCGVSMV